MFNGHTSPNIGKGAVIFRSGDFSQVCRLVNDISCQKGKRKGILSIKEKPRSLELFILKVNNQHPSDKMRCLGETKS